MSFKNGEQVIVRDFIKRRMRTAHICHPGTRRGIKGYYVRYPLSQIKYFYIEKHIIPMEVYLSPLYKTMEEECD